MKIFVWVLLLANALFFAVMQWGGLSAPDGSAAQPPLHEEKIALLSAPQGEPPAVLPASAPASAPLEGPMPLAGKPDALCMEWSEFSGTDLARATAALSALQLGDKLDRREVEYTIGYWVYIPPVKDKVSINQKIAQLKARGISEYFVVSEAGPWQNAISLGVFRTQEAAQHFLDELRRTKDVRSAQVGERASKLKMAIFMLNGLDAATATKLGEIQKDFAGSELKEVTCALTR
ncbi:MAG: hypothetical protein A3F73_12350 [Gallionellales bacterium RIFCSPLOWO2_12_FULL_59_22]|nr:MAG: hypothetical protein A3H99_01825 [Gallionellales bacterium RIFCSPLOWO2_02_FULL_59_110]OGT13724.1 MAG: hypothetical protein A3F73_12350 [Gallionellales bacterium RIFCSPLOWO2_12_FULL_59_22]